jgi:carboxyvinyl-carboxyphosphonate phosphorylmutase
VARAKLFAAEGADALFFTGVTALDQLRALHAATALPIILGGGPPADIAEVTPLGVRISLTGHQPIHAAFQAVHDTLRALRDATPLPRQADAAMMAKLTRAEDYAAVDQDCLGIR